MAGVEYTMDKSLGSDNENENAAIPGILMTIKSVFQTPIAQLFRSGGNAKTRALLMLLSFFILNFGTWFVGAADNTVAYFWERIILANPLFTARYLCSTISICTFLATCSYFTYLDLTRSPTKTQGDYWPTLRDMAGPALPQILVYGTGMVLSWVDFYQNPECRLELPTAAPKLWVMLYEVMACLVVGDFLIYWEHRIMHKIPFLRDNIHSVHHEYSAPFSWAGGWVHPLEDIIVVAAQVVPAVYIFQVHPLSLWTFCVIWVTCLVDEHSGHDVWWSPYAWLPFTGYPMGGGAAPHDIHHYKPWVNFGFIFIVWDHMFGTYRAVSEANVNPYEPPLTKVRRKRAPLEGKGS